VVAANFEVKKTYLRYMKILDRHFPFYSRPAVIDGKILLGGRQADYGFQQVGDGASRVWNFHDQVPRRFVPASPDAALHRLERRPRLDVLDQATRQNLEYETVRRRSRLRRRLRAVA